MAFRTFREIDNQIFDLIDPETGEIMDIEAFQALQMERSAKAENMALWVLDLKDEVNSIEAEIKRLRERKASAERKMDSLKRYLPVITHGQKIKTPLVSVSYRNNSSVELYDREAVIKWAQDSGMDSEVLKYNEPEISKTEVKKLLTDGKEIPGAVIIETLSTIIK